MQLCVVSSRLVVIICGVTSLLQDEFQVVNTNLRKPKVALYTGEAVLLKVLSPKCKFLFPPWGSFIIPHRLRKVSPFPPAIHPSEKVPNRLIVPSLFQLPVSKLAFFFFSH